MVFQDVYLFKDTFATITAWASRARHHKVEWAARQAHCYDFIMKLPKGYDTPIGEGVRCRAANTSGCVNIRTNAESPIIVTSVATTVPKLIDPLR